MMHKKVTVHLLRAGLGHGDNRHAQEIISSLGITYKEAVPQIIADCWQFFGCENVPESLPEYVTVQEIAEDNYRDMMARIDREAGAKST